MFGRKNDNEETIIEEKVKENRINSINEMRKENKINREKENLLNQIEEDASLIDNWSIERLLKLEKIYDAKIESYDSEIAMVKKQMP